MPILQIVVGTVIVFSKEGIGNLPAGFLNIIHVGVRDLGSFHMKAKRGFGAKGQLR
jgi:hypothetical protein